MAESTKLSHHISVVGDTVEENEKLHGEIWQPLLTDRSDRLMATVVKSGDGCCMPQNCGAGNSVDVAVPIVKCTQDGSSESVNNAEICDNRPTFLSKNHSLESCDKFSPGVGVNVLLNLPGVKDAVSSKCEVLERMATKHCEATLCFLPKQVYSVESDICHRKSSFDTEFLHLGCDQANRDILPFVSSSLPHQICRDILDSMVASVISATSRSNFSNSGAITAICNILPVVDVGSKILEADLALECEIETISPDDHFGHDDVKLNGIAVSELITNKNSIVAKQRHRSVEEMEMPEKCDAVDTIKKFTVFSSNSAITSDFDKKLAGEAMVVQEAPNCADETNAHFSFNQFHELTKPESRNGNSDFLREFDEKQNVLEGNIASGVESNNGAISTEKEMLSNFVGTIAEVENVHVTIASEEEREYFPGKMDAPAVLVPAISCVSKETNSSDKEIAASVNIPKSLCHIGATNPSSHIPDSNLGGICAHISQVMCMSGSVFDEASHVHHQNDFVVSSGIDSHIPSSDCRFTVAMNSQNEHTDNFNIISPANENDDEIFNLTSACAGTIENGDVTVEMTCVEDLKIQKNILNENSSPNVSTTYEVNVNLVENAGDRMPNVDNSDTNFGTTDNKTGNLPSGSKSKVELDLNQEIVPEIISSHLAGCNDISKVANASVGIITADMGTSLNHELDIYLCDINGTINLEENALKQDALQQCNNRQEKYGDLTYTKDGQIALLNSVTGIVNYDIVDNILVNNPLDDLTVGSVQQDKSIGDDVPTRIRDSSLSINANHFPTATLVKIEDTERQDCLVCMQSCKNLAEHAAECHACVTFVPVELTASYRHLMAQRADATMVQYEPTMYGEEMFLCRSCSFFSNDIDGARHHRNIHSSDVHLLRVGNGHLTCKCPSSQKIVMLVTARFHSMLRWSTFQCSECSYRFACEAGLMSHSQIVHVVSPTATGNVDQVNCLSSASRATTVELVESIEKCSVELCQQFSLSCLNNSLNYLDGKEFRLNTVSKVTDAKCNRGYLVLPKDYVPANIMVPETALLTAADELKSYLRGKFVSKVDCIESDTEVVMLNFDLPIQFELAKRLAKKSRKLPKSKLRSDKLFDVLGLRSTKKRRRKFTGGIRHLRMKRKGAKKCRKRKNTGMESVAEENDEAQLSRTRSGMIASDIGKESMQESAPAVMSEVSSELMPTPVSGEWSREHTYVCCSCGAGYLDLADVMDHKWNAHPSVWCAHTMVQGQEPLPVSFCRQFRPHPPASSDGLGQRMWHQFRCSLCDATSFENSASFHSHLVDCGGLNQLVITKKKSKRGYKFSRRKGQGVPINRYGANSLPETPLKLRNGERGSSGVSTPTGDHNSAFTETRLSPVKRRLNLSSSGISDLDLRRRLTIMSKGKVAISQRRKALKMKLRRRVVQLAATALSNGGGIRKRLHGKEDMEKDVKNGVGGKKRKMDNSVFAKSTKGKNRLTSKLKEVDSQNSMHQPEKSGLAKSSKKGLIRPPLKFGSKKKGVSAPMVQLVRVGLLDVSLAIVGKHQGKHDDEVDKKENCKGKKLKKWIKKDDKVNDGNLVKIKKVKSTGKNKTENGILKGNCKKGIKKMETIDVKKKEKKSVSPLVNGKRKVLKKKAGTKTVMQTNNKSANIIEEEIVKKVREKVATEIKKKVAKTATVKIAENVEINVGKKVLKKVDKKQKRPKITERKKSVTNKIKNKKETLPKRECESTNGKLDNDAGLKSSVRWQLSLKRTLALLGTDSYPKRKSRVTKNYREVSDDEFENEITDDFLEYDDEIVHSSNCATNAALKFDMKNKNFQEHSNNRNETQLASKTITGNGTESNGLVRELVMDAVRVLNQRRKGRTAMKVPKRVTRILTRKSYCEDSDTELDPVFSSVKLDLEQSKVTKDNAELPKKQRQKSRSKLSHKSKQVDGLDTVNKEDEIVSIQFSSNLASERNRINGKLGVGGCGPKNKDEVSFCQKKSNGHIAKNEKVSKNLEITMMKVKASKIMKCKKKGTVAMEIAAKKKITLTKRLKVNKKIKGLNRDICAKHNDSGAQFLPKISKVKIQSENADAISFVCGKVLNSPKFKDLKKENCTNSMVAENEAGAFMLNRKGKSSSRNVTSTKRIDLETNVSRKAKIKPKVKIQLSMKKEKDANGVCLVKKPSKISKIRKRCSQKSDVNSDEKCNGFGESENIFVLNSANCELKSSDSSSKCYSVKKINGKKDEAIKGLTSEKAEPVKKSNGTKEIPAKRTPGKKRKSIEIDADTMTAEMSLLHISPDSCRLFVNSAAAVKRSRNGSGHQNAKMSRKVKEAKLEASDFTEDLEKDKLDLRGFRKESIESQIMSTILFLENEDRSVRPESTNVAPCSSIQECVSSGLGKIKSGECPELDIKPKENHTSELNEIEGISYDFIEDDTNPAESEEGSQSVIRSRKAVKSRSIRKNPKLVKKRVRNKENNLMNHVDVIAENGSETDKKISSCYKKKRRQSSSRKLSRSEYHCLECGLKFDTEHSLEEHRLDSDDCVTIALEISMLEAEEHMFECQHCHLTFAMKGTHRKHVIACRGGAKRMRLDRIARRRRSLRDESIIEQTPSLLMSSSLCSSEEVSVEPGGANVSTNALIDGFCSHCGMDDSTDAVARHRLLHRFARECHQPTPLSICIWLAYTGLTTEHLRTIVATLEVDSDSQVVCLPVMTPDTQRGTAQQVQTLSGVLMSPPCLALASEFESLCHKSPPHTLKGTQTEVLQSITWVEDLLKAIDELDAAARKSQMLNAMKVAFEADTVSNITTTMVS